MARNPPPESKYSDPGYSGKHQNLVTLGARPSQDTVGLIQELPEYVCAPTEKVDRAGTPAGPSVSNPGAEFSGGNDYVKRVERLP
jgi:hypothetical protein